MLTETIFSWPGLGRTRSRARLRSISRDPWHHASSCALIYLLVNFLVDMSYAIIDPRVAR